LFSLIVFGDLDSDLINRPHAPTTKRLSKLIQSTGISCHGSEISYSHIRIQNSNKSYLDCFLSAGANIRDVRVGDRFGTSDHLIVSFTVEGFDPIRRRRQKFYSKNRARKLLKGIIEREDRQPLLSRSPLFFFTELSSRLRSYSVVFEPRPISYFKANAIVEAEIDK